MKKVRMLLSALAIVFAVAAAFASYSMNRPDEDTAWFKVNSLNGNLIYPYVQLTETPNCQTSPTNFCAKQYAVDENGDPEIEQGPMATEHGILISQ